MARAKRGFKARRRRNKLLKMASGYRGTRSILYRTAVHVVRKGLVYSYRDRRVRSRNFRKLSIVRINAACRALGINYAKFMGGLKKMNVALDRTVLSEMALHDQAAFKKLVETAQKAQ